MSSAPLKKLWGGRFTDATDSFVEDFTASVGFDRRLYRQDIRGSLVHARMLARAGIISDEESTRICEGLAAIGDDIDRGRFTWAVELEDVHGNIEAALIARIGDTGKKLHTGRSRNDQVATDLRLYARDEIDTIHGLLDGLQRTLLEIAQREAATLMPGFTHLQPAQPVTFGHHIMAWFEMLERDYSRLRDCRARLNHCPLGSAAMAGSGFPLDRQYTAAELGFDGPMGNSLDGVADRDFAVELAACCSLLMVHLSRFAEELVLWASPGFGFIDLPQRFCTGSSIMPQKKNPDVPELVRGKSGRVCGHLTSLLMLMKSQPLAYNKDNQEDKEPLFDTVDTVKGCLRAFTGLLPEMQCRRPRMREAAAVGHPTATDLADYLVRRGLPFRDAHAAVGAIVTDAEAGGVELAALPLARLQARCPLIGSDVFEVLGLEGSVAARSHVGGTAPAAVQAAVAAAREALDGRAASKDALSRRATAL